MKQICKMYLFSNCTVICTVFSRRCQDFIHFYFTRKYVISKLAFLDFSFYFIIAFCHTVHLTSYFIIPLFMIVVLPQTGSRYLPLQLASSTNASTFRQLASGS